MFEIVNAHCGKKEQYDCGEKEYKRLFLGVGHGFSETSHCTTVPCELQDVEYAKDTDDANGTKIKPNGEIERENGNQIDKSIETEYVTRLPL